ncbi:unnamed protein product [Caenorhabditis bovis]|uniref:Anaphase-promoting complex subunit 2 n=1 Tax=Caenorhabditis bovis TaxID=2654633 RepID=A0A8S1ELW4_9PELO|nr:unnamed protein product [Caenorhabditis bovis]
MDEAEAEEVLRNEQRFKEEIIDRKSVLWLELERHHPCSRSAKTIAELQKCVDYTLEVLRKTCADFNISEERGNCLIAQLMFPMQERQSIAMLLKPYFLGNFMHWRLSSTKTSTPIIEPNLPKSEEEVPKEEVDIYIATFSKFLHTLVHSPISIKSHLNWILTSVLREVASAYVRIQLQNHIDVINCLWFSELLTVLQQWCSLLKSETSFGIAAPFIYKDITKYLTETIYQDVVEDYPSRYNAIVTLRLCLQNSNNYGREMLAKRLISDIEKKLLLAAVDTKVILNAYASCVEALRELDTTCVLMHRVCGVIKEYLKKRPDTVQQIISYITSDKKEELEKDMTNTKRTAMMDEEELKGVNDEFLPENLDTTGWNKWEPHPMDAPIGESSQGRQGVDVFNMLVSVYGSKEMFVKEYRSLLAERLSNSDKKDPEFEKRYLNLLKLRFQYSELQHCEVMLSDVVQSQKIDKLVAKLDVLPISACIISAHYWPKIEADPGSQKLPEPIEQAMEKYAATYSKQKERRNLNWIKGAGCVQVEIELDGFAIEKTVPNTQAAVLYLLLEREIWTAAEIAEQLGISSTVAKRRLDWWTKQGLLSVQPGTTSESWSLTRNPSMMATNRAKSPEPIDEDELANDDAADMIESLEQYWSYTLNYISNHSTNGEVKAERMHRVYRMFGSPTSAGPTLDHVIAFLQRKVQMGLLTCEFHFPAILVSRNALDVYYERLASCPQDTETIEEWLKQCVSPQIENLNSDSQGKSRVFALNRHFQLDEMKTMPQYNDGFSYINKHSPSLLSFVNLSQDDLLLLPILVERIHGGKSKRNVKKEL